MKTIYMDNNATTRVAPEVIKAMMPYFDLFYGNPSSAHSFGEKAGERIEEARSQVSGLLNARPTEIIFTSGGTESDATAIRSALEVRPGKRRLVTSAVEHPAVRSLYRHLGEKGYRITEVRVNGDGELDMEAYQNSLTEDTALVSMMWANNETGVIFPVELAAEMAHQKGILFHTDAVQAVGKINLDLKSTAVDMLSLSGHKLQGPKGIGALYVRRGIPFKPMLLGGHQEHARRAGSENVPGIIGLGAACWLASRNIESVVTRIRMMRDRLERGIIETVPATRINGLGARRLANTSNISFDHIEGESILMLLDEIGVSVSTGSACSSGSIEPSHVLLAMGLPSTAAQGAVRFSLGTTNTQKDVEMVLKHIPGIIERLRAISPLWPKNQPAYGAV